ncbi:epoxide hydrolase [Streptomyces spinoverrucosus]|uniref:epoxide hydrolase family protein n=1 Tax=Streptomyces spinoverrucosus TaxID=284043 RepID=UPI001A29D24C|nr:epoxide hydrolase family protein [Streptomyces spinoverrucosus]MBG0850406.1 epoxide hydrolase [Streptomyces spinoverrucosus]
MTKPFARRSVLLATGAATLAVSAGVGQAAAATSAGLRDLVEALPTPSGDEIVPFKVRVPQSAIDDLRSRLAATRLPDRETAPGWVQGAPLSRVRDLIGYWHDHYDWRRLERRLNGLPQFRTTIDGLPIHFIHVRSRHRGALPLLLTHGWPGSIVEFLDVIGPLTDPVAYGGKASDAFDVVIPALPGYGFSGKPTETGWGLPRIATAWDTLMTRLGYSRYVAQGGDWGAGVTTWMAKQQPAALAAVHLNLPILFGPPPLEGDPTPAEQEALKQLTAYSTDGSAYALLQGTRPQTIGYGLADSPAGQAAWIYEKLGQWSDSDLDPDRLFGRDRILDNISLYWHTNTAASSARLYAESFSTDFRTLNVDVPVGVSVFPKELYQAPKVWAERTYSHLFYWNDDIPKGGHFAAFEQPDLFVTELRNCFRSMR